MAWLTLSVLGILKQCTGLESPCSRTVGISCCCCCDCVIHCSCSCSTTMSTTTTSDTLPTLAATATTTKTQMLLLSMTAGRHGYGTSKPDSLPHVKYKSPVLCSSEVCKFYHCRRKQTPKSRLARLSKCL